MAEGTGLRQSHFGSGYDAGKARLQAEVEQLRAQVDIDNICIGILETKLAAQSAVVERAAAALERFAKHTDHCGRFTTISGECSCGRDDAMRPALLAAIDIRRARLDAADVPASTGK